jgi:hypothetical protein
VCDGTRAVAIVLAATASGRASRRRRGAYLRVVPYHWNASNDAHGGGKQELAERSGRRNCSAVIQPGASTLSTLGLAQCSRCQSVAVREIESVTCALLSNLLPPTQPNTPRAQLYLLPYKLLHAHHHHIAPPRPANYLRSRCRALAGLQTTPSTPHPIAPHRKSMPSRTLAHSHHFARLFSHESS